MADKWLIAPGETRVIDLPATPRLKVGLIGGQIDVITHDEPGIRIEVQNVTVKDLRIEASADQVEIDHPQLGWDNFLEVFRNFGAGGPKAEVSVAVPKGVRLNLGVVSAGALVSGLASDAKLNTVSGDIIVDTLDGDLSVNAVSGDIQVRDLHGAFNANSVSGEITVAGRLSKVSVDTVSGATLVDASGRVDTIGLNSVSGAATIRLDADLAANYVLRSAGGRMLVDGVDRASSGPSSYSGSTGELAGSFVDVRVNTVSGDITVLRRSTVAPATADEGLSE